MKLYLIRHADAVPQEEAGGPDADRPLTDTGFAQARALAVAFRAHGVVLDLVLTSPLLRARQTAQELLPPTGPDAPAADAAICEHLAPGGKRRKLARYLEELGKDAVALVGHRPDIDQLAGWLIGTRKARVGLAKGATAFIECAVAPGKGMGTLRWLVTPEWAGVTEPSPNGLAERSGSGEKRKHSSKRR